MSLHPPPFSPLQQTLYHELVQQKNIYLTVQYTKRTSNNSAICWASLTWIFDSKPIRVWHSHLDDCVNSTFWSFFSFDFNIFILMLYDYLVILLVLRSWRNFKTPSNSHSRRDVDWHFNPKYTKRTSNNSAICWASITWFIRFQGSACVRIRRLEVSSASISTFLYSCSMIIWSYSRMIPACQYWQAA